MEHFICKSMENQRMQCEKQNMIWNCTMVYPPLTFIPQPFDPSYSFTSLVKFYSLQISSFKELHILPNVLEFFLPSLFQLAGHHWVIFINQCIHHVLSLIKPLLRIPIAFCIALFLVPLDSYLILLYINFSDGCHYTLTVAS